MHEDLLARRADYPILERATYLINNSLGAMPQGVYDRLREYAHLWATKGIVAWTEDWLGEMRRVADLVGAIIGAPPGTTVLHQNVASLLGPLASSFDFAAPRNRVVYTELDWPGSHYLWTQTARLGAETVVVRTHDELVAAIDERTLLVPICHVLFESSTLVDIAPVVARAHEVGAVVVLEAYHSAGAVPLDVVAQDVDVCIGGSVKWLCGGPGAGWMYVRPSLVETLRPVQVGWFGHARPFDFDYGDMEYAPGVARFVGGTPGVPSAYAAAPGYQAILDIGVARIRERSASLTQPLFEDAVDRGLLVNSPADPARRGGHVTVSTGVNDDDRRIHDELIEQRLIVDFRPGAGLRIAPHFYNTSEECAAVVAAIAKLR